MANVATREMAGKVVERPAHAVVVCGGGPAGAAAAIAAARAGADAQLIESSGALGGTWTSGLTFSASDWRSKTSFMVEIEKRLELLTGQPLNREHPGIHPALEKSFYCPPEWIKLALESLCQDAGVAIRFHTRVVDVERDPAGRILAVITESKGGRERWPGTQFIDATGDGDLAFLAGCGFDLGRPGTGHTQPMSMLALVTGLKLDEVVTLHRSLSGELARAGFTTSYGRPGIVHLGNGLFGIGVNHEYGCGLDPDAVTQATLRGRAECCKAVAALRSLGGMWASIEVVTTSAHIGVREGRRIHADYTVTRDDLIAGRRHEDAICRVYFPVDVHATENVEGASYSNEGVSAKPYDIPLRAVVARDVRNLLLAGRCIGGDFVAHASYRVIGNVIAIGQAAGSLAALAAREKTDPREIPFSTVSSLLTPVS